MEKETHNCLLVLFFLWLVGILVGVIKYPEKMDTGLGWILLGCVGGTLVLMLIFDRCLHRYRRNKLTQITFDSTPSPSYDYHGV
jgi:putative effector of murein hydrolase LrgA (UPF0299 family)